jgi:hypothetical protein
MSIQELAMQDFKGKDFSAPIIFKGLILSLFNLMSPQIFLPVTHHLQARSRRAFPRFFPPS